MIQLVRPSGVVDVPTAMITHDEGQQSSAILSAAGQIRNAMLTEPKVVGYCISLCRLINGQGKETIR